MYGSKNITNNHRNDRNWSPCPRRTNTFMSPEDIASGKKSHWLELEITGCIKSISPQLWDLTHLTSLYLNDNMLQRVPPDICRLHNLMYLDLSSNKIRSLPAELGEMLQLREILLSHNQLRVLPYELGKLFQLSSLGLEGNPLSSDIKSIYNEVNGTQKLLSYLLDNLNITASQPPQRPWIPIAHPEPNKPVAIYTVMCYNVLCDKYCTRQLYGYCPSWALNWEYRKKAIIEEIRQYSADIISLQEVETEQFYNFFLPELKRDGYEGIFSPKSRAKTMSDLDKKHVDGCAIFFRATKFDLVKEHLIEFNQLAMSNAEGSHDMINRVMTKDNIGLAALLETKEAIWENGTPTNSKMPLLVATCHIHWDPEYSDVKLIQNMMLMSELKNIVEESQRSLRPGSSLPDPNSIPLLLCGDLNSLPDSGVVEYLSTGKVSANHIDFRGIGYSECLRNINLAENNDLYTHGFRITQAYEKNILPYTNYTYEFKGIIDYIFFSKDFMRSLGVLGPLDTDWFVENKVIGCPHPHIPSDHLPLLVELEMTPNSRYETPISASGGLSGNSSTVNKNASAAVTAMTNARR